MVTPRGPQLENSKKQGRGGGGRKSEESCSNIWFKALKWKGGVFHGQNVIGSEGK